jgi:hypothetical protein
MKGFSQRSVPLFAAAMALCAFVLPSTTSASSWGVVGSHHTLDSPNLGFTSSLNGGTTASCTRSSFTVSVASPQNMEILAASFGGLCTLNTGIQGRCTMTAVGTRFPWTATPLSTVNIQVHGVQIDLFFEHIPGEAAECNLSLLATTITGTLTGGRWTGNDAGQHSMDFRDSEGLVWHSAPIGVNVPTTWRGLLTDTQNTLTVTG